MNEQNSKKIIDSCPLLFNRSFYFECGDGWVDILIELCTKIKTHLQTLSDEDVKLIVVDQVKQKYGTLRFYVSYEDDVINDLIKNAMQKSAQICEQCGAEGKLRGDSWIYCACDAHTDKKDLM